MISKSSIGGVRVLPPVLVLILVVLMFALGVLVPDPAFSGLVWRALGALLVVAGAGLTLVGNRQFAFRQTNIRTFDDPTKLVDDGLFAVSRNPMYLGFLVLLAGIALLMAAMVSWIGPLMFLVAASQWYIPFEEERMAAVFGQDYTRYRAAVPRWLSISATRSLMARTAARAFGRQVAP